MNRFLAMLSMLTIALCVCCDKTDCQQASEPGKGPVGKEPVKPATEGVFIKWEEPKVISLPSMEDGWRFCPSICCVVADDTSTVYCLLGASKDGAGMASKNHIYRFDGKDFILLCSWEGECDDPQAVRCGEGVVGFAWNEGNSQDFSFARVNGDKLTGPVRILRANCHDWRLYGDGKGELHIAGNSWVKAEESDMQPKWRKDEPPVSHDGGVYDRPSLGVYRVDFENACLKKTLIEQYGEAGERLSIKNAGMLYSVVAGRGPSALEDHRRVEPWNYEASFYYYAWDLKSRTLISEKIFGPYPSIFDIKDSAIAVDSGGNVHIVCVAEKDVYYACADQDAQKMSPPERIWECGRAFRGSKCWMAPVVLVLDKPSPHVLVFWTNPDVPYDKVEPGKKYLMTSVRTTKGWSAEQGFSETPASAHFIGLVPAGVLLMWLDEDPETGYSSHLTVVTGKIGE